jgi:hypothetical protein
MALATRVQERYAAQRLIELTNPGEPNATTLDTDRLTAAADDVEADFHIYNCPEYDDTDAKHVTVAVEGVIAKLYARTDTAGASEGRRHDAYIARLTALSKITRRDRISPRTSSILTPSPEQVAGETVRPDTDRADYSPFVPDSPLSTRLDPRSN